MSLRVLMVTARYPPYVGGIETHVREVAPRVSAMGVEVTVLTTDVSGTLPSHEHRDGVEIVRVSAWPSNRDWYVAPALAPVIADGRWSVVHVQGIHTAVPPVAMLAAARTRVPYVVSFHTGGHSSPARSLMRPIQWLALRPLLMRAERLIGVSDFEAERFRAALRLRGDRFTVVRNGAGVLPRPADGTVAASRGRRVLSVGRLERYKGHHRVIAALPHLPDTTLEIVGTGPAEAWLRHEADAAGVANRVTIRSIPAENREEMAATLRRASVVTLLSDYEAHPVAVMEALAADRPVLVAATTGLIELGEAGLARTVRREASPREVADAIQQQIEAPLRVHPSQLPTWEGCAASLVDVYRAAVGTAR